MDDHNLFCMHRFTSFRQWFLHDHYTMVHGFIGCIRALAWLCSGFGIYWFWESDTFLEVSMPTVIVLEQHFVGVLSKKKVDVQSP